jgi:hypothetical protein
LEFPTFKIDQEITSKTDLFENVSTAGLHGPAEAFIVSLSLSLLN